MFSYPLRFFRRRNGGFEIVRYPWQELRKRMRGKHRPKYERLTFPVVPSPLCGTCVRFQKNVKQGNKETVMWYFKASFSNLQNQFLPTCTLPTRQLVFQEYFYADRSSFTSQLQNRNILCNRPQVSKGQRSTPELSRMRRAFLWSRQVFGVGKTMLANNE